MVGPVPGNQFFGVAAFHATKADEGFHFVHVAAHGFFHQVELADIVVDVDGKEVALAAPGKAKDRPIEQRPALQAIVTRDNFS